MNSIWIKWSLWCGLGGFCITGNADAPADYWQQFSKAKELYAKEHYNEALPLLEQLERSQPDYNIELVLGDTYSALGDLLQAKAIYQQASFHGKAAQNTVIERVALFKIARTQLALTDYHEAMLSYKSLLGMHLDTADKQIANDGFNSAYASEITQVLTKARALIDKNEGAAAYQVIAPYLQEQRSFDFMIIAGQSRAIMNEPQQAFNYFKQSEASAKNTPQKRIALLGMINMQMELRNVSLVQDYMHQLKQYTRGLKDPIFLQKQRTIDENLKALKKEIFLKKARSYIEENEGKKCFDFIKKALYKEPDYSLYLLAAESRALINLPEQALDYYQNALQVSVNDKERIDALLGIGKMQFWLARYVAAKQTYTQLLNYQLSGNDYQLALAGLVKSYAYYDRSQKAYQQIPKNLRFTSPHLVVAAAQASSWAGWTDITKEIITDYQSTFTDINPKSNLGKDWRDLVWQTDLATWPNEISPSFFASRDTETFHKERTTLDYRHYWSYFAQTSLGPEYIKYSQYQYRAMDAKGFYLNEQLNLGRHVSVLGKIEPMNFTNRTPLEHSNWNPVLWNATTTLKPNDYLSLNLQAQKEVIETFPAFSNHITDDQYATTVSISPWPYLRLDSSFSRLDISDDNVRKGFYFAGNLLANPDLGFSTIGILRGFSNQFKSPDYFSPYYYQERKLLFRLGRRMGATWHYYIDGGFGRQYITSLVDTQPVSSPTYQWGIGINGPLTKNLFVTFYYINTHQASAFLDSVGYAYQCGGLSFNLLT